MQALLLAPLLAPTTAAATATAAVAAGSRFNCVIITLQDPQSQSTPPPANLELGVLQVNMAAKLSASELAVVREAALSR